MTSRTTKRSIPPLPRPPRQTRRGITAIGPEEPPEPAFSSRPTRRDVKPPEPVPVRKKPATSMRGQFSIAAARGVGANVVSGEISSPSRERSPARTQPPPVERVRLVSVTRRSITLAIDDREVTLDRQAAIELASMIFTSFGTSASQAR